MASADWESCPLTAWRVIGSRLPLIRVVPLPPQVDVGGKGWFDLRASVGNTVVPPIVESSHPVRQQLIASCLPCMVSGNRESSPCPSTRNWESSPWSELSPLAPWGDVGGQGQFALRTFISEIVASPTGHLSMCGVMSPRTARWRRLRSGPSNQKAGTYTHIHIIIGGPVFSICKDTEATLHQNSECRFAGMIFGLNM